MERTKRPGGWAQGPAISRRLRGFSSGGREADIGARLEGVTLMGSGDPLRLASAVRAMRRARHLQGGSYDPARHAALLRLLKTTAPPRRAAQKDDQK